MINRRNTVAAAVDVQEGFEVIPGERQAQACCTGASSSQHAEADQK